MLVWITHDRYGYSLQFKAPHWNKKCSVYERGESFPLEDKYMQRLIKIDKYHRSDNFCLPIEFICEKIREINIHSEIDKSVSIEENKRPRGRRKKNKKNSANNFNVEAKIDEFFQEDE